jgi:hypothetical protein
VVSASDIYRRVRLRRDLDGHAAGEECTIIDIVDGRLMVEFDDHEWGTTASPDDLELVGADGSAAA